jgi:hypothetical protein
MPIQDAAAEPETPQEAAPENATQLRSELERVAFARPGSAEGAAAAEAALRRLVAADQSAANVRVVASVESAGSTGSAASAALAEPVATGSAEPGAEAEPVGDEDEDAAVRLTLGRRSLVPLLIVIGIVVGLGVGLVVTGATPGLFPAATVAVPGPSASSPHVPGSTTNALAELASRQTPRDVFPNADFAKSLHLESTSVHRILETAGGQTLWVARSPQKICLMISLADSKSNIDAGASCVSIARFSANGITLGEGDNQWSWNGSTFATN